MAYVICCRDGVCLLPEARWHGSEGGYSNHRCRCTACTAAHAAYYREPGQAGAEGKARYRRKLMDAGLTVNGREPRRYARQQRPKANRGYSREEWKQMQDDLGRHFYDIAAGDFPPGDTVKCGNRADLPKTLRRHNYQELGPDVRNRGERGFVEGIVSACRVCGTDKFKFDRRKEP